MGCLPHELKSDIVSPETECFYWLKAQSEKTVPPQVPTESLVLWLVIPSTFRIFPSSEVRVWQEVFTP